MCGFFFLDCCSDSADALSVSIGGAVCEIESVSHSAVTCITGPRKPSVKAKVMLKVKGKGQAITVST